MSAKTEPKSETFPNERPTPGLGAAISDLVAALAELAA